MQTWWQREIPDVCCKCNLHWRAMAGRFPWCTRFNSWMRPFVASRSNRSGVNPFLQLLLEVYAGFLGDVPQLLDDRQNQRHTLLMPQLFHLEFGIAGNQRAVGARRRLGGAKNADVIVDLTLKR